MKFRTEIKISDAPRNLTPERLVVLAGSCFSDNIGSRIAAAGWPAIVNPCGVVYNPVTLALLFQLALTHRQLRREIIAQSLTEREGRFVSWFMSSKVSADSADECVEKVNEYIDSLEYGIEKGDAVILTFGTSDVWLLAGTDRAVGNCHKHPSSEFDKKRVGVDEIVGIWKEIISGMRMRNPDLKVILTVSPRRYLADGFADNTRQKAVLILGCEKLCKEVANVVYFPAYEILNDDLRDYRFYAPDLLHPSEQAVEYIWEKFKETFLDETSIAKISAMEREARRDAHRPIVS